MAEIGRKALALVLCLLCMTGWAQDINPEKYRGEIVGRVVQESTDNTVQRWHLSDAVKIAYAMPGQEVAQVRQMPFSDPAVVPELIYKDEANSPVYKDEANSPENHRLLALQAKLDAKSYYKAKGVFWTTLGSTILHPVAGLATGSVLSAVPPNTASDLNPNRYLMKDPVYQAAYQKQAHRRKAGRAAAGLGVGAAVLGVISFAAMGGM